jgi:hypothetical protein
MSLSNPPWRLLGVADFQARHLLGTDHYARLIVRLREAIAMDDVDKIDDLLSIGEAANWTEP